MKFKKNWKRLIKYNLTPNERFRTVYTYLITYSKIVRGIHYTVSWVWLGRNGDSHGEHFMIYVEDVLQNLTGSCRPGTEYKTESHSYTPRKSKHVT